MDIVDQIEAVLKRKTLSSKREQARAALAVMLEAVGEPVAMNVGEGVVYLHDLSPLKQALAALEQD